MIQPFRLCFSIVAAVAFTFLGVGVRAQSAEALTPYNQVNLMVFDEAATSPAFISRSQYYNAFMMAQPYLPFPKNVSALDIFSYPSFINTAVLIANISSQQEMAMYLAQVMYETNGLTFRVVPPCSSLSNCTVCSNYTSQYVNNTGGVDGINYYGRGHLYIQNASEYLAVSQALFNDDSLLRNPNFLVNSYPVAWATAAWKWKTYVKPVLGGSDAFGLTTKYLRPADCAVPQNGNQTQQATTAFQIYEQVLSAIQPNLIANSAGCFT